MTAYPLVGAGLPVVGPHAVPEAIARVAAADSLGLHSRAARLATLERLAGKIL